MDSLLIQASGCRDERRPELAGNVQMQNEENTRGNLTPRNHCRTGRIIYIGKRDEAKDYRHVLLVINRTGCRLQPTQVGATLHLKTKKHVYSTMCRVECQKKEERKKGRGIATGLVEKYIKRNAEDGAVGKHRSVVGFLDNNSQLARYFWGLRNFFASRKLNHTGREFFHRKLFFLFQIIFLPRCVLSLSDRLTILFLINLEI